MSTASSPRAFTGFFPKTNSRPGSASPVVVTTRTVTVTKPRPTVLHPPVLVTPPTPAPSPTNKRKRVGGASSMGPKRLRVSRAPSASSTLSSSSARDTPARLTPGPPPFGSLEAPIPRPCAATEDGNVAFVSAEDVVVGLKHMYKSYFKNPEDPADRSFEPDGPGGPPVVELEYPNTGARERFVLLQPKDKDHYNPIFDLRCAIHTIIEYYLTDEQAALFGTHPREVPLPSDNHAFSGFNPPSPYPDSGTGTPAARASPAPAAAVRPPSPAGDLIRQLGRAFNAKNGPAFVATVQAISTQMRVLKSAPGGNPLAAGVRAWAGVPPKVYKVIIEQTYQRTVGPRIKDLRGYEAWTSTVYGELMPNFISDLVHYTGLAPGKHLLDLGCGVGNVVLQAALQSGCSGVGVEVMPKVASLARTQCDQLRARLRLWALDMGDAAVLEGDFRTLPLAAELARADVVLVNNFAFEAKLNDALSRLFLDLREDTIVVSLRPFVPANFRLTQHNAETPVAILRSEEREFRPGTVSWSVKGGTYYINRIDRSMVRRFADEQLALARTRATRGTRRIVSASTAASASTPASSARSSSPAASSPAAPSSPGVPLVLALAPAPAL